VSRGEGSVLVVDDDHIVRDVLERYLAREGFAVTSAADGEAAIDAVENALPDLIVLDLMLPLIDGVEVFRRLRSRDARTPVIMLTARGKETDRVVGLRAGADDYVAKPFSPREVVARCQAVLRRTRQQRVDPEPAPEPLEFDGLWVEPEGRKVSVDGQPVSLTPREFDLLLFFARNPGIAFDRMRLLDELWDIAYSGDPSTVTVHVRRLREKIEPDPSNPRRLVTVWGSGYRFEP
jgi:two-component system response regulator ResD